MGELFVQESAVTSEKENNVSPSDNRKKVNVKDSDKQIVNKTEKATYSHDEAVEASIAYFNGDELAARVWANKYALKDSFGNLYEKTPDDMHHRLAREIHRVEMKYKNPLPEELIYNVLKDFRYIVPQGGPMTGIGNGGAASVMICRT
ncbi:MAG: hypothetical protein H6Q23_722 [Bacteroidetes bacterium]|nr:hypothetical protein [Bacteroidota bacterium]